MDDLRLAAQPVPGLPEIEPGVDLAGEIASAAGAAGMSIDAETVLVIAQKVVSKEERRVIALETVAPTPRALELAGETDKDPRVVQLVLDESEEILRAAPGLLIVRTRTGLVCANAGIDRSNLAGEETACLLPTDPDASARRLRRALRERVGAAAAVVISDSFGRPWRLGQLDVAIGCAGLAPLDDRRGSLDAVGRELAATVDAVADAAAAAAALTRSKSGREAVVLVGGLGRYVTPDDGPGAAAIIRPLDEDLFR
jgi:coenzyme F420-0:L-glutamate ligase/coenzyme F420-1:gamma-L-glutamate ligase